MFFGAVRKIKMDEVHIMARGSLMGMVSEYGLQMEYRVISYREKIICMKS